MVGGRDFKQSEFNRAVMAVRQPGSSFKPFLYLAAIDSGITPSELFIDEPLEIVNKYTHKVWKPKNYGNRYIGPVILKEALTKSLNSIAVKLIQRLGPRKVINYARMLGIKSDIGPHLSVALGAVDITLLEMVTAYSTIANEGIRVEPRCITRVVDRTGSVIYKEKYQGERVVDENSVYMLIDMMKNVVTSGTGTRARLKRPCAGKTGTTNNYIDAWFCGFTPDLVTCVYVGHDDRQALGPKMAGGTVAAPLWKLYMEEALKDKPVTDFRRPKGIRTCSICRDSGLIPSRYCDRNMSVAFRRGSEPDEMCDSHMVTQTADNYFEMDGSIIIRPHVMENDSGSVIETDSQFEAPPQPVSELVDNSSLLKMPDSGIVEKKERTERTRFKGTGRSKFQNKHGNPFSR
jgi:penicillin-binding protein 1A